MKELDLLPGKGDRIRSDVGAMISVVPVSQGMIADLTKLHLEIFSGYMNARIGAAYVRAFIDWFCIPEHGVALAATDSIGEPLGYVVGAKVGYAASMNRDLFWVGASALALRPWLWLETEIRKKIIERVKLGLHVPIPPHPKPSIPEPTMALVSLAVLPAVRRHKIGLRLLQSFEARAREIAVGSLRLSVYPGNTTARQFYEQCGWQPFANQTRSTGEMYYYYIL